MKFINKYLKNLAPYKLASHMVWEVKNEERHQMLKLDWNEATIPPTPLVKTMLKEAFEDEFNYYLYPSTSNEEILKLLSKYCKVPQSQIQYFPSSDTLHEYILRMFVSPNDSVLLLGPTYDNFRLTCESQGAKVSHFNYDKCFELSITTFKDKITEINPSLVFICNPNNPTGNFLPISDIENLLIDCPETLFLVDEAYYEFSNKTCCQLTLQYQNLLVTRTFSKAFALANFRAGYLISSTDNINEISKIRNPKNIASFTQIAIKAALQDLDYMYQYVEEVAKAREYFKASIETFSFVKKVYRSEANFLLIEFDEYEIKMKIFQHLLKNNIFVRDLTHHEMLKNTLRVTIGTRIQMQQVINCLKQIEVNE